MRFPISAVLLFALGAACLAPAPLACGQEEGASTDGEKRGWLLSSPLVNVGWPELKMPSVDWSPGWGDDNEPGWIDSSINRVRGATRGAAAKTRLAWNKTVERLKFRSDRPASDRAEPSFFAKLFTAPEPQRGPATVSEFLSQDRPGLTRK